MPKFTLTQTAEQMQSLLDNVVELSNTEGEQVINCGSILPWSKFNNPSIATFNIESTFFNKYEFAEARINKYNASMTGTTGLIGRAKDFNYIKVMVGKNTAYGKEGYKANKVRVEIYKVPTWDDVKDYWTFNDGKQLALNGYFRQNNKWIKIVDEVHEIELKGDDLEYVEIPLNNVVENPDNDLLYAGITFNYYQTVFYADIWLPQLSNKNDAELAEANRVNYEAGWNTFGLYYATPNADNGPDDGIFDISPQLVYQNADIYQNANFDKVLPVLLYRKEITGNYELRYDKDSNFYKAVSKVTDNMGLTANGEASSTSIVPEICLAKQYDAVVGDTLQLFYRGIIKSYDNYSGLCINVICNKGIFYPDFFEYTPIESDVGSHTLTIQLRDLNGRIVSTSQTTIVVNKNPVLQLAKTINMLCFGDSLTSGGIWCAEGIRRLVGTADSGFSGPASLKIANLTINTYGHNSATVNTQPIKHEGYGGWTWNSFLTNYGGTDSRTNGIVVTTSTPHNYNIDTVQKSIWTDNNGLKWELEDLPSTTTIKFNRGQGNNQPENTITLPTSMTCESLQLSITITSAEFENGNPFWNEDTNQVDFKNWAKEMGCPSIDVAAVLLTWNGGVDHDTNTYNYPSIDTKINQAKLLLTKLHTDYPNCKIIVLGLQVSSLTGGTGANYNATGSYADMWGAAFFVYDYNKALEEMCLSDDFKSYCYYVDTKAQFDTIHNMPHTSKDVNTRSKTTFEMGTNGVHPSTEGYYQIGDAFFRKLVAIINE